MNWPVVLLDIDIVGWHVIAHVRQCQTDFLLHKLFSLRLLEYRGIDLQCSMVSVCTSRFLASHTCNQRTMNRMHLALYRTAPSEAVLHWKKLQWQTLNV